jgi:hypothetical protein
MAVEAFKSVERTPGYRGKPVNDHGKFRVQHFTFTADKVGDANSTIELCKLPEGEVRVYPSKSRFEGAAFGAARTLDIGHRKYQNRANPSEPLIAEDPDAFVDGLDVSAAVADTKFSNELSFDLFSQSGVGIFATVLGGTIPNGTTISGYIVYTHE